jgi:dolichyl-phosphate-mannose-protein mannosyltransferase
MATDTSTGQADSRPYNGQHRADTGPRALSDRLPWPWLFPVIVFAGTWVLILAAWVGYNVLFHHHRHWTYFFLIDDTRYYQAIAQQSYTSAGDLARGAFFPLFPILIRIITDCTGGNYLYGGLIATVLTGLAAVLAVWAVARHVCGRRVADYAVLLFAVFPGAMALAINYSEPLAVALAAVVLLALLKRQWLLAGLIGALATAERPTLVVLAIVALVVAAQAIRDRREWRALLAPVLTPVGILAFFAFLAVRFHNDKYWFWIEKKGWNQHFDFGQHTFATLFWLNTTHTYHLYFVLILDAMFACAVAGIILMLMARLPMPLVLFGILTILMTITSYNGDTRPRYVWVAFPIFIGAAARLPRWLYWPVLVLSAIGFVLLVGGWRSLVRNMAV